MFNTIFLEHGVQVQLGENWEVLHNPLGFGELLEQLFLVAALDELFAVGKQKRVLVSQLGHQFHPQPLNLLFLGLPQPLLAPGRSLSRKLEQTSQLQSSLENLIRLELADWVSLEGLFDLDDFGLLFVVQIFLRELGMFLGVLQEVVFGGSSFLVVPGESLHELFIGLAEFLEAEESLEGFPQVFVGSSLLFGHQGTLGIFGGFDSSGRIHVLL